jgi:hypothetical protein
MGTIKMTLDEIISKFKGIEIGIFDVSGTAIKEGDFVEFCYGGEYDNEKKCGTWKSCGCIGQVIYQASGNQYPGFYWPLVRAFKHDKLMCGHLLRIIKGAS